MFDLKSTEFAHNVMNEMKLHLSYMPTKKRQEQGINHALIDE
jgi:hypothetical protein